MFFAIFLTKKAHFNRKGLKCSVPFTHYVRHTLITNDFTTSAGTTFVKMNHII